MDKILIIGFYYIIPMYLSLPFRTVDMTRFRAARGKRTLFYLS